MTGLLSLVRLDLRLHWIAVVLIIISQCASNAMTDAVSVLFS